MVRLTWYSFRERLMVHLYRLDLCGEADGREGYDHPRLDHASLHAPHGHSADAADLVHVLGRREGLGVSAQTVTNICQDDNSYEKVKGIRKDSRTLALHT